MPINPDQPIDVNEAYQKDEELLDSILESPEVAKRLLTIDKHKGILDQIENGKNLNYPGIVLAVDNLHLLLPIIRKIHQAIGIPNTDEADAAFNHELDHVVEAINQGVNLSDVKFNLYLLKKNTDSRSIDAVEVRTSVKLPDSMLPRQRKLAMIEIANAPKDKKYSTGDLKIINS